MVVPQPTQTSPRLQRDSDPVNFLVSLDDLLALARHWFLVIHDYHEFLFYYRQSWSTGRRNADHAHDELDRIAKVVGEDAIQKVSDEVRSERRREMGEDIWAVYQHGDTEARKRVAEELHGNILHGGTDGEAAEETDSVSPTD